MNKNLPIGISDFEQLITENYYFVDKSLLIKELLDTKAAVTLIPRPRRFGKTLNMSMLRYFFEKTEINKQHLFFALNIAKHKNCMAHQGQYPMIFITFKDIKKTTWDDCYKKLIDVISKEFKRHDYLLKGSILDSNQKRDFKKIMAKKADLVLYESALENLSAFLADYHKKKPIILIDEYDTPVHAGFINNYYEDVINFMRSFLCGGLKDNPSLEFSVITGILRVARESIFSGINNLMVCSFMSSEYSDKFGLLEHEVESLLAHFKVIHALADVKKWYNGYVSGAKYTVYNPWSIINLARPDSKLQPYWINTSDNALIKNIIEQDESDIKEDLELLIADNSIKKEISENIVFEDIFSTSGNINASADQDAIWSFLLFSGYLTIDRDKQKASEDQSQLVRIPNQEVAQFYKRTILAWCKRGISVKVYNTMLRSLLIGDIPLFKEKFHECVLKSLSVFDTAGNEPEKFYHALVLGMLTSLDATHDVTSNKESGYGRYDVKLTPKDRNLPGIIIEFKKVRTALHETLEAAADAALAQIEEKKYDVELKKKRLIKIIKLGISFEGKRVLVKERVD